MAHDEADDMERMGNGSERRLAAKSNSAACGGSEASEELAKPSGRHRLGDLEEKLVKLKALSSLLGIAVMVPFAVSGQAAKTPMPEFYGTYVVAEGKLYGIDTHDASLDERRKPIRIARTEKDFKEGGGAVAQVPVLSGSINLLVFVKESPLETAEQLKLRQLSFVRRMTINENDPNFRQAYLPNTWVAATEFGYIDLGATAIEMRFKPVKGEDEMVLAVPASPLTPGIYILGKDFLFAVTPIETAESSRCIDAARPVGGFVAWRTWPCTEAPSTAPAATTSATPGAKVAGGEAPAPGSGESALGFIVTGSDVPVFGSAESTDVKAHLTSGTSAANAKGTFLGSPKEFSLEESNGRTHIVYLQERRIKVGWVDSRHLIRFEYDCSCKSRCDPLNLTLLQGSSWNDCFERARNSQTPPAAKPDGK